MSSISTEKQWEHLLSNLSPNKIVALEKTLKSYQSKYQLESKNNNDKENNNEMNDDDDDIVIKSEPVTSTKPFLNSHRTKNRGLTYENGRRNLKAERVSIEEMDRRAKRRERNRIAAAKCRERRQLQLDDLQQQVEMLRSNEHNLKSTLKQLEAEEVELRTKLSNHNCVISESNNGEISILINTDFNNINNTNNLNPINNQNIINNINNSNINNINNSNNNNNSNINNSNTINNTAINDQYTPPNGFHTTDMMFEPVPIIMSSHSICRPRSLPVPCQNCTSLSTDSFFDKSTSLGRIMAKDDSLTPLLSPDTFSLLKGQLKTDNTPTTPNRIIDTRPNVKVSVKSESTDNMAFSWNHSIVDQLSKSCSEPSNTQYLSTPVVDMPYYANETYTSQLVGRNINSMGWHTSH